MAMPYTSIRFEAEVAPGGADRTLLIPRWKLTAATLPARGEGEGLVQRDLANAAGPCAPARKAGSSRPAVGRQPQEDTA